MIVTVDAVQPGCSTTQRVPVGSHLLSTLQRMEVLKEVVVPLLAFQLVLSLCCLQQEERHQPLSNADCCISLIPLSFRRKLV